MIYVLWLVLNGNSGRAIAAIIAGRLLTDSLFSIVIVVLVHTMVLKVGDFDCSVLPIAGRPATIK